MQSLSSESSSNYLALLAISDSGFIFDPRTGHSFSTNQSGVAVVKQLRDGFGVEQVVQQLKELHGADAQVERDVGEFIAALRGFGWLPAGNSK